MAERLAATGGIVPEFVNPKWADAERPGPGMAVEGPGGLVVSVPWTGNGRSMEKYGEYPLVI